MDKSRDGFVRGQSLGFYTHNRDNILKDMKSLGSTDQIEDLIFPPFKYRMQKLGLILDQDIIKWGDYHFVFDDQENQLYLIRDIFSFGPHEYHQGICINRFQPNEELHANENNGIGRTNFLVDSPPYQIGCTTFYDFHIFIFIWIAETGDPMVHIFNINDKKWSGINLAAKLFSYHGTSYVKVGSKLWLINNKGELFCCDLKEDIQEGIGNWKMILVDGSPPHPKSNSNVCVTDEDILWFLSKERDLFSLDLKCKSRTWTQHQIQCQVEPKKSRAYLCCPRKHILCLLLDDISTHTHVVEYIDTRNIGHLKSITINAPCNLESRLASIDIFFILHCFSSPNAYESTIVA